jgi:hypothetical protein
MRKTSLLAAGAAVVLAGGGGYGALVWWPQQQAKTTEAQASVLFDTVRAAAPDLTTGAVSYDGGTVTYAPVSFSMQPHNSTPGQPVTVTLDSLTVTPAGVATGQGTRLTVTGAEGQATLALGQMVIDAFQVKDGIPLHLKARIGQPSLEGPMVDKARRQLGVLDLLLANAPQEVQAIPDRILSSAGQLTAAADLRYAPDTQRLDYASAYELPGLLGLKMSFGATDVSVAAMQSANLLATPQFRSLENPALAELAPSAVIAQLAQQGTPETVDMSLRDQGVVAQLVQVYAAFTKLPEAEARARLVATMAQYPVERLLVISPTPEALGVVNDARSALLSVLKGEAQEIAVTARPRDREAFQTQKLQLANLNDLAVMLDIDFSAR